MEQKPQFPRGEEEIRANELVRLTEGERRANTDHLKNIPVTDKNYRKFEGDEPKKSLPRGIVWALVGIAVLFIGGFGISFYIVRNRVVGSISSRIDTLQQGVQDLQHLDPQSAKEQFASLSAENSADLGTLVDMFSFLFKGGSNAVGAVTDISGKLAALSGEIVNLEKSAFTFFSTGQGGDLVSGLTNMKTLLAAIDKDSNALSDAAASLGSLGPVGGDSYIPLKAQMGSAQNFLKAFIPWLASSTPHHLLLLFQNPSEMRPGGGFLGSYADVTLVDGNVTKVDVRDIADVDKAFKGNIVPPKPLQLEGARFRPADGNWFFDFPTSASETIALFESSTLYASTTFDGAIALTPKVISDLLTVIGPVTIGSGKSSTTFTANNLVVQIQKIVQDGQATAATYPKAVLSDLAHAMARKFASSTDMDQQNLLAMTLGWIAQKDAMVYFKDPALQSFAVEYGISGAVYELPQNFNGDYLAIANADINADKSELSVHQDVNFNAVMNGDGTETNHLIITRTHTGDKSPYWWYKTTNQDYLQVFVAPGSTIDNTSGGAAKKITPPANFLKNGYSTDPLVSAIESSTRTLFNYPAVSYHSDEGKQVFETWSGVKAADSTKVFFDYSHRLFGIPVDGQKYQFVFEKQSGATGHFKFEINAPLGFVFAENDLAAYDYESDDVPGRLIVNLTLQKM